MHRRAGILCTIVALASPIALASVADAAVPTAKAPACAGKTKTKAIKAVKATWATLFDTNKTVEQRLAVVEDATDPEFRVVLDDIVARFGTFLESTTAKVRSVKCAGKKEADVTYDLIVSGQLSPGIAPPGTAVLLAGKWSMSQRTLCDLFGKADPALLERGACAL